MKIKYLLLITAFILFSCEEKDDNIITDPASFSEFFINNKSDTNLDVEFVLSDDYLNKKQTSVIKAKDSKLIFEGGAIAHFPQPNEVLSELKFYDNDSNQKKLLLTISPVVNSDWKRINTATTLKNYHLFEYTITNELLK